jgi:hypothetical protein
MNDSDMIKVIINKTKFFENYLHLLNSLPLNKLKSGYLYILYDSIQEFTIELN